MGITIGYSATFVAGFLAIVYVVRDFVSNKVAFDKVNPPASPNDHGIVCFATLFSFVGTVRAASGPISRGAGSGAGIPRKTGLMIVIWNAILHARWGGIIRERGMVAAIFGNVITAWSFWGQSACTPTVSWTRRSPG